MCVEIPRTSLMLFCKAAIKLKATEQQKIDLSGGQKGENGGYTMISWWWHTEVSLSPSQYHLAYVCRNQQRCMHTHKHSLLYSNIIWAQCGQLTSCPLMIRKCETVSNLSQPSGLFPFCAISHISCRDGKHTHPNPTSFHRHSIFR